MFKGMFTTGQDFRCVTHFLYSYLVVSGLQELQDLRAEGDEEEARGLRVGPGSPPGPRRADRGHRAGAERAGLLGQVLYFLSGPIMMKRCG